MKNPLITVFCLLVYVCSSSSQEPPSFHLTQQERGELANPLIDNLRNLHQNGGSSLIDYLKGLKLGTLDQTESGESTAAIAGTSLSKLFFEDQPPFDLDRLLDGNNLVRTSDEFKTSIALYTVIEMLLHDESTSLIQWLVTRSIKAPATRCDKVVLTSLPSEFNGFSGAFWNGSYASWKAMLTAKNPVYRLIALRNVHFFETDSAILLADYQNGLNESNTLLQNAAFEGLKRLGTPAARASLQSFLNLNRPANDGTMSEDFDINATIQQYLNPQ